MRDPKGKATRLICGGICALSLLLVGNAGAGNLEPPAAPGPTMKTLDEIPPTWSQFLDSSDGNNSGCNSSRFRCIAHTSTFSRNAVLDLETGLVWSRRKSSELRTWYEAYTDCMTFVMEGPGNETRMGFRLPAVHEYTSLSTSAQGGIPDGHPFSVEDQQRLWTSTDDVSREGYAYEVSFGNPNLVQPESKNTELYYMCVRGGN